MAGGAATPQKMAVAERRALAVELRKQGGTYRQIADQLRQLPGVSENYDHTQAHNDVMEELKRIKEKASEDAEAVRTLELARLDELFIGMFARAKQGDYAAFDRVMILMNQRAKYLPVTVPVEQKVTQEITQSVDVHGDATTDPARIYQALALALASAEASNPGDGAATTGDGVAAAAGTADASVPQQS